MSSPEPFGLVLDGGRPPTNSFVLREHKIVYISVTKVACSGLRWMLHDLAGEDRDRFYRATGPHLTRLMTVHGRREKWRVVTRLSDMPLDEVEQVSVDNGWFVFAVVRDPWSRLWSAWESKFLVRHPEFVARYADEPWFPRIPDSPDEVVEDFDAFVEAHPWTEHPLLAKDSHFWPQVRSVRPDGLGYSGIYDLDRLSELTADVHTHLAGLGLDAELYLPRANETPLALTGQVLAGGTAERIRELYADDFERFGDRWSLDDLRLAPVWSPDAIRAVDFHAQVSQRMGDISAVAMDAQQQLREARKELKATRQELRRTRQELARATQPAEGQADGALRRVGRAVKRATGR